MSNQDTVNSLENITAKVKLITELLEVRKALRNSAIESTNAPEKIIEVLLTQVQDDVNDLGKPRSTGGTVSG